MSWKESCVMDEKIKFIADCLEAEISFSQLCRHYEISRKTGYKWLNRYKEQGAEGLCDRSQAPLRHPNAVNSKTEEEIVNFRGKHPTWGPRKLLVNLRKERPDIAWPCKSTVADILKNKGLSAPPRRKKHCTPSSEPLAHCKEANDVWCIDFKGWFRTGDRSKCVPLTITDGATRFILRCQTMKGSTGYEQVKPLYEAAFREFGMPLAIRTDNGPPFAGTGLGGLSRLAVWLMRLGIRLERIRPGKPQENGRHERMHRTLKAETANPPEATLRLQQKKFMQFREEFNFERPHEALDDATPGSLYEASDRKYPARLPRMPAYPKGWETRKVRVSGRMKWSGKEVPVSIALKGQRIGLKSIGGGLWEVYFMDLLLGTFDELKAKVLPLPRKKRKKKRKVVS